MVLGKDKCFAALKQAIAFSTADQTEAKIISEDFNLTRFANSTIHQNLNRVNSELQVRVVFGTKVGSATTNRFDEESIRKVVAKATQLALLLEDNPHFKTLPEPKAIEDTVNYYQSTANYTAEERAADVAAIVRHCDAKGFKAFGSHITTVDELAVMNSLGVEAYNASTYAYLRAVIEGPTGTGYADALDRDVSKIDADAVGAEAVNRCAMSQNPHSLPTGEYDVVFLPYAVSDIVRFPAMIGFAGQPYEEGRSYMARFMGKEMMGGNISIWDDGLNPETLNMPFDVEGTPKKRVDIVKDGVATGVVYDHPTALRYGKEPTGHARYRRGMNYESPQNIIMAAGDSSVEEMIKATKKGILVTRFHYTHCPEHREVVMTGTTRDGIFWIEDGEVRHSLLNMRLTDSVLTMLSNVDMISRERKLQRDWWSTYTSLLPAIRVKNVKWTGSTTF